MEVLVHKDMGDQGQRLVGNQLKKMHTKKLGFKQHFYVIFFHSMLCPAILTWRVLLLVYNVASLNAWKNLPSACNDTMEKIYIRNTEKNNEPCPISIRFYMNDF